MAGAIDCSSASDPFEAYDLAEQLEILAQIERARLGGGDVGGGESHRGLRERGCGGPQWEDGAPSPSAGGSVPRRRSISLERVTPPSGFAGMVSAASEEAAMTSPGRPVLRSPSDGDDNDLDWSERRRRAGSDELLLPEILSTPPALRDPLSTSSFDGADFDNQAILEKMRRSDSGMENSVNEEPMRGRSHRLHHSEPASAFGSGGGNGGRPQHQQKQPSIHFDESMLEEQEAILREIERQQRHERGSQTSQTHKQNLSLPALPESHFDESMLKEQEAIMREIEKQKQERQNRASHADVLAEPSHRLSMCLSAGAEFLDGTSLEEQRAMLARIEQEKMQQRQKQRQQHRRHNEGRTSTTTKNPSNRMTKPTPGWTRSAAMDEKPQRSLRSGIKSRERHLSDLDDRVAQKRSHFLNLPREGRGPSSSSPSYSLKESQNEKSPIDASSSSILSEASSFSVEEVRQSGRHRVVLVDGRGAVAESGGRKKRILCAGCESRLTVSHDCKVVFCPRCETLTPTDLSEAVGAWEQS